MSFDKLFDGSGAHEPACRAAAARSEFERGSIMKTAELTGAMLDYWVAKALNLTPTIGDDGQCRVDGDRRAFSPSTEWATAGPIIERERIVLVPPSKMWYIVRGQILWSSCCGDYFENVNGMDGVQIGETPLIAAMRCYVASKFGDEVSQADPNLNEGK